MILTYNVGDAVEYSTRYDVWTGGAWVPARVVVVHHEDGGNGTPFTRIEVVLYNHLRKVLYEPAIKMLLR